MSLRREFGRASVHLGRNELSTVRTARERSAHQVFVKRLRDCGADALAEQWVAMAPESDFDPELWADPDHWMIGDFDIRIGERTLHAVETPGHTAGHYVFADFKSSLLFAGDHVMPSITPSIGFHADSEESERLPLQDFLASLSKIQRLSDLRLPTEAQTVEHTQGSASS